MTFDIWKPMYVDDFAYDKYLYHYTSVETAIKIICSNSLLFSQISKTNDTSESKMKIVFEKKDVKDREKYKKMTTSIAEYFTNYSKNVQLLCFSTDAKITENERKKYKAAMDQKEIYFDVSGRGFALPRMWAQYAKNNEGICFVFNRKKLLELIEGQVAYSKSDSVKYKKFFDRYSLTSDRINSLYEKISMIANGSLTMVDMLHKDKDFLKYNFFEKLDDWKNEHEFRVIALIDKKDDPNYRLSITGITPLIEGVVIGENMDPAYENTIKMLIRDTKNKCEVKRILFDSRMCKLK